MRIFLIALLLAGCSATQPADIAAIDVPDDPMMAPPPPPSTPPPPVPPPPPDAANFLTGPDPVLESTGDPRVDAFRDRIFREAGSGWRPYLLRLLDGVVANPELVAAYRRIRQPQSPAEWVRTSVTPQRIAAGRRLYLQMRRNPPPSPDRTPLEVRLAMWGTLADYGAYQPRFDIIQAYLMLGAYELGPAWTYFDFYKVAELIVTGQIDRAQAKVYEDGRIGQVQFLPGDWSLLARDGDGDGKIDVWGNRDDILASIGPVQWEPGVPMVVEVGRPKLDPDDPREGRILRAIEGSSVGAYMFPRPRGGAWPPESHAWHGRFVEPFGPAGPAFLLTRNFTPVNYRNPTKPRYWNETEDPGFGLAVALLAEAIAGRPAPSIPVR